MNDELNPDWAPQLPPSQPAASLPGSAAEQSTPFAAGYRLAAEWERHAATWLAWPTNREDWPGKFGPIPWVYTEIVRWLSLSEPVHIVVPDKKNLSHARKCLKRAGVCLDHVRFHRFPLDRGWLRDSGPIWLVHDQAAQGLGGDHSSEVPVQLLDFRFNAWAKYENHRQDDRLPKRIARDLGQPRAKPTFLRNGKAVRAVLEGGAIDVNGRGTLLTTEECLLSHVQQRNPGLDRAGYERLFRDYLGVTKVIWLGQGIVGDDTHGHVDDLARFVGPTTVVTVVDQDPSSPNYDRLMENHQRLLDARDQDGQPLRVVELPMPRPVVFEGQLLPASYANFYIANSIVLVPTFNDPADRIALNTLAPLFPDRQVVGIHAVDLVWGLGTLHCLTRDQPQGPATPEA